MGLASDTATAQPVTMLKSWEITNAVDTVDVTAFGDDNKVWVSGLADVGGSFDGFYDEGVGQLYTAASDGAARKFYLYPNTNTATAYFFGTGIFDFNLSGGVDSAVEVSGNWKAASKVVGQTIT